MSKRGSDRIMILAFEGPDKAGKSTIIRELNRRTNYEYLCIDRFVSSAWVYDALYGRRHREQILANAERELANLKAVTVVTILLKCERDVLLQRIARADEAATARMAELDQAIQLYDQYSRRFSILPVIEIDTTHKSLDETVSEIIQKVSEL